MVKLLAINPIIWLALIMSALTIGWCLNLLRRLSHPHLRIGTYMVALVCVFQGVRLLREQGIVQLPMNPSVLGVVELCVTVLYFCLILIFQIHNQENRKEKSRLRLAEASENVKVVGDALSRRELQKVASL